MSARALKDSDAEAGFRCDRDPSKVEFLTKVALGYESRRYARVFVLTDTNDTVVCGFFTLSMASIRPTEFPPDPSLPRHPLPVAMLGRLARHDDRKGIGETLMIDALRRVLALDREIGCLGVMLHAVNAGLVAYYQRFGFEALPRTSFPRAMFLAMASLTAP